MIRVFVPNPYQDLIDLYGLENLDEKILMLVNIYELSIIFIQSLVFIYIFVSVLSLFNVIKSTTYR